MKNKKLFLIFVVVVLIFVFLWAYFFWLPVDVTGQRIDELKKEGIVVKATSYDVFYSHMTNTFPGTLPEVGFTKTSTWSAFKQQVITAKAEFGSVTVWVDRNAGIFWFALNYTTLYYYEVP